MTDRPNVELHIDALVLHGFAPGDRHAITQALEAELTRLLAERGVPPSLADGTSLGELPPIAFDVEPGALPGSLGSQLAQSIYDRIGAVQPRAAQDAIHDTTIADRSPTAN